MRGLFFSSKIGLSGAIPRRLSISGFAGLAVVAVFTLTDCGSKMPHPGHGKAEMKNVKSSVVGRFFDEALPRNGFHYAYPAASSIQVVKNEHHQGRVSLQFDLAANDFSGGSLCLKDSVYRLDSFLQTGVLQFWIKGSHGNEKAWVALVDEDRSDGKKTVVRLSIDWFGPIGTGWSLVSVPLKHFGEHGVYWDAKEKREVDAEFDWDGVAEFRIEVKKDDNESFRVWIDDVAILKSRS